RLGGAGRGLDGAMVQMVSHGLISGALFLCVGVLYDRVHSRQIADYGGVVNTMPVFAAFMVLFALANTGLPGTSGFVGEFLVIIASFRASFWYSLLAALEICLAVAICLILLVEVFAGERRRGLTPTLTLLALAVAAGLTVQYGQVTQRTVLFDRMYVADELGFTLKLAAFLFVAVALLYSRSYLENRSILRGEYYVLALTALLGIFVLVSANNLLTVYLGVELLALSVYAMVAFDRDSGIAAESAMKYFVLGAVASGALLYGMSLIYGLTGTRALAVMTLIVGNVVAIVQTNLKRMLAYSTIANVGFIVLGFVAGTPDGYAAALYYTLVYVLVALGSFGVILLSSAKGFEADQLEDYKGLYRRDPLLALAMMALMFSTAGVPPLVGFWAKLRIFQVLWESDHLWLVVIAAAM